MKEEIITDTILDVHNGTIDINELTKRLDEMIPPIKIEEEKEKWEN